MQNRAVCRYWNSGKCRMGDACRFAHPLKESPNSDQAPIAAISPLHCDRVTRQYPPPRHSGFHDAPSDRPHPSADRWLRDAYHSSPLPIQLYNPAPLPIPLMYDPHRRDMLHSASLLHQAPHIHDTSARDDLRYSPTRPSISPVVSRASRPCSRSPSRNRDAPANKSTVGGKKRGAYSANQSTKKQRCKFFFSAGGCQRGRLCHYSHEDAAGESAAKRKRSADDQHIRKMREELMEKERIEREKAKREREKREAESNHPSASSSQQRAKTRERDAPSTSEEKRAKETPARQGGSPSTRSRATSEPPRGAAPSSPLSPAQDRSVDWNGLLAPASPPPSSLSSSSDTRRFLGEIFPPTPTSSSSATTTTSVARTKRRRTDDEEERRATSSNPPVDLGPSPTADASSVNSSLPSPSSALAPPASPLSAPASPLSAPASPLSAPASPVSPPASPLSAPASPLSAPASPVSPPASPLSAPASPVSPPLSPPRIMDLWPDRTTAAATIINSNVSGDETGDHRTKKETPARMDESKPVVLFGQTLVPLKRKREQEGARKQRQSTAERGEAIEAQKQSNANDDEGAAAAKRARLNQQFLEIRNAELERENEELRKLAKEAQESARQKDDLLLIKERQQRSPSLMIGDDDRYYVAINRRSTVLVEGFDVHVQQDALHGAFERFGAIKAMICFGSRGGSKDDDNVAMPVLVEFQENDSARRAATELDGSMTMGRSLRTYTTEIDDDDEENNINDEGNGDDDDDQQDKKKKKRNDEDDNEEGKGDGSGSGNGRNGNGRGNNAPLGERKSNSDNRGGEGNTCSLTPVQANEEVDDRSYSRLYRNDDEDIDTEAEESDYYENAAEDEEEEEEIFWFASPSKDKRHNGRPPSPIISTFNHYSSNNADNYFYDPNNVNIKNDENNNGNVANNDSTNKNENENNKHNRNKNKKRRSSQSTFRININHNRFINNYIVSPDRKTKRLTEETSSSDNTQPIKNAATNKTQTKAGNGKRKLSARKGATISNNENMGRFKVKRSVKASKSAAAKRQTRGLPVKRRRIKTGASETEEQPCTESNRQQHPPSSPVEGGEGGTAWEVLWRHKRASLGLRQMGKAYHLRREDDEYFVEKVLEQRVNKKGKREVLVKWFGYPVEAATWEPYENVIDDSSEDSRSSQES